MSLKNHCIPVFRISRYAGWLIAPFVFFTGLVYSGASLSIIPLIEILILSIPYSVMLFGINDLYDRESDKLNPRKNIYNSTDVSALVYRLSVLTVLSLLLTSLITLNLFHIVATCFALFVSYFYSAEPVRLKEIPVLDSLSNGIIFFSVFSMGYSFGGGLFLIPLKIYFVALCVAGIHTFGAALDYDADRAAGHRTIAVFIGRRASFFIVFLAFLSAYLFSGIGTAVINYYFIYCIAISLLAFLFPDKPINFLLFKLIFAGFIFTTVIFIFNYRGV